MCCLFVFTWENVITQTNKSESTSNLVITNFSDVQKHGKNYVKEGFYRLGTWVHLLLVCFTQAGK